jgi:hypothetical protein
MPFPSIRSLTLLAVLCTGAFLPSRAHALQDTIDDSVRIARLVLPVRQAPAPADSGLATPAPGPRAGPSGIDRPAPRIGLPAAQDDAGVRAGSNIAMMGVGAAAIVVGSIVGGDGGTLIALGGAVIGLIGLFRYLR